MDKQTDHHHILPLRVYIGVGAALLAFTVITVWVSYFDLGPLNLTVAMLIASFKAILVALFFMHLLYDNKFYLTIFTIGILFLGTFIIFTMFDTMTRGAVEELKANPITEEAAMYETLRSGAASAHTAADTSGHEH
ncbi:cytochrome C oxidase subunit IV family protein [candidate division KSB1 bacterium]